MELIQQQLQRLEGDTISIVAFPSSLDWLHTPIEKIALFDGVRLEVIVLPESIPDKKVALTHLAGFLFTGETRSKIIGWDLKDLIVKLGAISALPDGFLGSDRSPVHLYDIRSLYQLRSGETPISIESITRHRVTEEELPLILWQYFHDLDQIPTLYSVITELAILAYARLDLGGIYRRDGHRVFTNYRIDGTISGRLSANGGVGYVNPLVMKAADRRDYRPDPNHKFLLLDYSSMEIRVLATICQSPPMLALLEQPDFYASLARLLYKNRGKIMGHQKAVAKALCLMSIFGGGPHNISRELGIPFDQVSIYQYQFEKMFPAIKAWELETHISVLEQGRIVGPTGRVRVFPDIRNKSQSQQASLLRQAQNFIIQSMAADINTLAFLTLDYAIRHRAIFGDCKLLFHIHDGYLLSVPEDGCDILESKMRKILENVSVDILTDLPVKLRVKSKLSEYWD